MTYYVSSGTENSTRSHAGKRSKVRKVSPTLVGYVMSEQHAEIAPRVFTTG